MQTINGQNREKDYLGPTNKTLAIFLISILGLFLEMLFIRWISTEVRIFAFLQNTVLVVCFMGLGVGCFTSRQPIDLHKMLLPLFFIVLLFAIPITRKALGHISEMLSVLEDLVIWYNAVSNSFLETILYLVVGMGLTYFLMIMIVDIFVPIGRLLGRLMDDHSTIILAYSANVAGSLIGVWLFVLMSFFHQPPVMWFAVWGMFTAFWLDKTNRKWKINVTLIISIIVTSWFAGKNFDFLEVVWSPYQKLAIGKNDPWGIGVYGITVNNVGYQGIINLSDSHLKSNPQRYPLEMRGLSPYDMPLLLHPNPEKYLIVGAGGGNDAAGGIRHGVNQITAVEIDPAIISIGQRYHPEKPYSSPNVQVVEDDARSFFATCKNHYDVILFGLLDSHTTTAMTNARLDHYVYTRESITHAKSLLAEGGVLILRFAAQKPFIADRMARVLRDVFGKEPISFYIPHSSYGLGGETFISGDLATVKKQIAKHGKLASLIKKWQSNYPLSLTYTTKIATDDWPYIYLKKPFIPIIYYLLAGLLPVLFIRSYRHWNAYDMITRWRRSNWHFFFLGAAFLLLEVQNISKASVVLGNTWEVNAVIVSGVLAMVLLANLVVYRIPNMPLGIVYVVLIATCLALYFVDLARFAFLPYAIKAVVVGLLTTLPMLFSGIVFIRSFAVVVEKDEALGANLIGALVGALLQSVTFVIGIKALLLIVAGFYFLSLLTKPIATGQEQTQPQ
jgi:hypothetical protein